MAQNKTIHFKISDDLVIKIDNWRRKRPIIPSRVAVIRYAIEKFVTVQQEQKKGRN